MTRKIAKNLYLSKIPMLWRLGPRFFARPVRVRFSKRAGMHFSGGPSPHRGNRCPKCNRRMTLLWDIDLGDTLIPEFVREGFAPATRLPFYTCWQCVTASYAVLSDTNIRTFEFDNQTDFLRAGETPFDDAPDEMTRQPIALKRIPTTIDALLSLAKSLGVDEIDSAGMTALREYFDEEDVFDWNLSISQIGGSTSAKSGFSSLTCPNPKCPANSLKYPFGEHDQPYLMKDLALIHWDGHPILGPHCFEISYSVCGICFSIRSQCRSD
jgi:hypothetical protein